MKASKDYRDASDNFLLGIDGGGTACRALLMSANDDVLGRGTAGPANPLRNPDRSFRSILQATQLAFEDAGLDEKLMGNTIVGVGLAGVNVPAAYDVISNWQHPYHSMYLTTDMQIACYGSHGCSDGAVIISGTGCSGYSSISGDNRVHSAFGFPFGDKGGAAWIGLAAIRAAFLAYDKLGPPTVLTERIAGHYQAKGIGIVEKLAKAQPYEFGRLAPLVFAAVEDDDEVARVIIADSANHISAMAQSIWQLGPTRMSFVGGLSETIEPWLSADTKEMLSPSLYTPLDGAILYAKDQLLSLHKQHK